MMEERGTAVSVRGFIRSEFPDHMVANGLRASYTSCFRNCRLSNDNLQDEERKHEQKRAPTRFFRFPENRRTDVTP